MEFPVESAKVFGPFFSFSSQTPCVYPAFHLLGPLPAISSEPAPASDAVVCFRLCYQISQCVRLDLYDKYLTCITLNISVSPANALDKIRHVFYEEQIFRMSTLFRETV